MFSLPLSQKKRHILHIDADAFFASVEQVLNPKLKGKAVLVGGPSGTRGIVSAASYEARKFGIHAGMAMYLARRKCPSGIVVNGNFEAYRKFSRQFYKILLQYTPDVEMASIDEAYVDITGCAEMQKLDYPEIARKILEDIYKKSGLSISCGMASSKIVAKVASSQNKPHKLTIVPYGREAKFLAPLPLKALPGIGPRTYAWLEAQGLKKIEDLARLTVGEVMEKFGVQAIPLWKHCLGIDNSPVISAHALPKSISKEHTFYEKNPDKNTALKYLKELAGIVFEKLRAHRLRARTVFVKIRYKNAVVSGGEISDQSRKAIFTDFGFQKNLEFPTSLDMKLFPVMRELFLQNLDSRESLRLIGIGVSNLFQNYNLSLFENDDDEQKLFFGIDAMKKLYGEESVRFGI